MKITGVDTFILHVPVTQQRIADSTHVLSHWGAPGVIVHTDAGIDGFGYSGTHAHLAADRLITSAISKCFAPLLIGSNPLGTVGAWSAMINEPALQWVGRGGITHLAIGAIDVALWDIKAKASGQPLWQLLGGRARRIAAYNTDGGWLNWPIEKVVEDCRRSAEVEGFTGIKIKVGSPNLATDAIRLEAVRKALGPEIFLAVDANGRMDVAEAIRFGRFTADCDVAWFEEPINFDDISGHARLASSIATPIALGEQLYLPEQFANFIGAKALHYAQPDVARLGGVSPWLQVADLAHANNLPVVSHIGDMMQVHIHTAIAHPACEMLEHIPWMRDCFVEPVTAIDGYFEVPETPGAGTTLRHDALERFGVATGGVQ